MMKIKLVKCNNDHLLCKDPIGMKFELGMEYELTADVAGRVMSAHPGCFMIVQTAPIVEEKSAEAPVVNKMAGNSKKEK